jgi:hypothetical protein
MPVVWAGGAPPGLPANPFSALWPPVRMVFSLFHLAFAFPGSLVGKMLFQSPSHTLGGVRLVDNAVLLWEEPFLA